MPAIRRTAVYPVLSLLAAAGLANAQCADIAKLLGSSPANDDHFGASLSMSAHDTMGYPMIAVGMPNEDAPGAGDDAGGFRVFQRINGWSTFYSAWNTTGVGGERLGSSIGLADPYLIAGAPMFANAEGRARIYTRSGSSFFHSDDIVAGIGGPGDEFGASVAISGYGGGWCVVGAPYHDFHGEVDAGAAFFYIRDDNGQWVQEYQIWGGDYGGDYQEHRGESVAMAQITRFAAVGAPNGENNNAPADHGVVHIVQRLDNGLPGATTNITPPSPEAGEHFGAAVSIERNLLVVGAPDEDMSLQEGGFIQQASDSGALYIFEHVGNSWNFVAKMRSPLPMSAGRFGARVSTDGHSQIVVSEPGSGRVYLISNADGAWRHQGSVSDPDAASAGSFGSRVAARDGDIAISDRLDDHSGAENAGAVYAFRMEPDVQTGDTCATAFTLTDADTQGCTTFATPSAFQATTCGNGGLGQGNDVWFVFTPACNGNAIVDTFGSEFDTVLSVHDDCPNIFDNHSIACNDDANFAAPNNRASLVTFNFVANHTYYIRVTGYSQAHGQFTLRSSYYYTVPNDSCANATVVGDGAYTVSTCGATSTQNLPNSCNVSLLNDVWFAHTASQTGDLVIRTCGANFDTMVAVYNGTPGNCPDAQADELACNDDANDSACGTYNSLVTVPAIAGQQLMIRVGGFNGSRGSGTLVIEPAPAPCDADVNCDGSADQGDIACIILAVSGDASCYCQNDSIADFNLDGSADQGDIATLIQVVAGAPCP